MAWFVQTEYKDRDDGTYWTPEISKISEEHLRFDEVAKALGKQIEKQWIEKGRDQSSANYPAFANIDAPRLSEGWRFPAFSEPLRDQLKHEEADIVDIVSTSFGTYAISQPIIDLIEAIEPGVHQFLPYEMLMPDGSVHPAKRWLLNICTRAEVLDTEKSNVVVQQFPGGRSRFADITVGGSQPHLIAKRDEASRRAIWCEWRYASSRIYIVSDQFWTSLRDAGAKGWGPHPAYPNHIEEL